MNGMSCLATLHEWNELPGYDAFHSFRGGRREGGVAVLVCTDMQSEFISKLSFVNDIYNVCSVKLFMKNKVYIVVRLYSPPSNPCSDFNSIFPRLLENRVETRNKVIIAGDFNIDLYENPHSVGTVEFINEMRISHFLPLITIPTRATSH